MRKILTINKFIVIVLLIASFLRLYKLDQVPVSLFGDELDLGYQAYSILKTGRDYSGNFMPLHFQSLAEWRTPLYLYSAVPTVAIFGISPFGVRLPAAIFGILGVWLFYLLVRELLKSDIQNEFQNRVFPILAALILAISPWHIQYSRAGFEVTQMLTLFTAGILLFLKGLVNPKLLPWSAVCLSLTPWVYSTAKLFTPIIITVLILVWRRELLKVSRKWILLTVSAFMIVGLPIALSTVFGGGMARFSYLSIFTDPTVVPQVGWDRLRDARVSDPNIQFGVQPNIVDKLFHNKFLSWGNTLASNYLQVFSTQFLFIKGDLNLRHSISEVAQFYRIEVIFLLAGIAFFLISKIDTKVKTFLIVWLLVAPLPAILTRDGGMHASRLFFILPVMILIISFGIFGIIDRASKSYRTVTKIIILTAYIAAFIFYQHSYWVHYPWESERWWHSGWREAIQTVKAEEKNYDRVIISTAGEPPWIFFAGWYEYSPGIWHDNFPFPKTNLQGYGEVSHIGKFYFASPTLKSGIYSLSEFLDEKTLYVANAKEFNVNIIKDPETLPKNLRLIRSVAYPSGEPAFYLLTLNLDSEQD